MRVGKTEIRLLANGSLRCADPDLLGLALMLLEDYRQGSGYEPDLAHAKMMWLCQQIGGKITFVSEDKTVYPPDVCFSPI